jgi:hypothetical protein
MSHLLRLNNLRAQTKFEKCQRRLLHPVVFIIKSNEQLPWIIEFYYLLHRNLGFSNFIEYMDYE